MSDTTLHATKCPAPSPRPEVQRTAARCESREGTSRSEVGHRDLRSNARSLRMLQVVVSGNVSRGNPVSAAAQHAPAHQPLQLLALRNEDYR